MPEQPAIRGPRDVYLEEPDTPTKAHREPLLHHLPDLICFFGVAAAEEDHAGDAQGQGLHLATHVALLPIPPGAEHLLGQVDDGIVIAFHALLVKRRDEQLALLEVLFTVHADEAESDPLVGRALRSLQHHPARPKGIRVTEDVPVVLRAECHDQ